MNTLAYGVCCICGQMMAPWDDDRICWDCDVEETEEDEEDEN